MRGPMKNTAIAIVLGAALPAAAFAAAAPTAAAPTAALPAHAAPAFVAGPYQYLPLTGGVAHAIPHGTVTWAFASGECGEEVWRDQPGRRIAGRNVAAFVKAGKPYIVSTGGADHKFTCAGAAGMERFVSRYDSAQLVGIDFDIEDGQSAAQVDALMAAIRDAQRRRPALRYSFTLATHAAGDGSRRSLNPLGESILAAIERHGVRDAVLNLMVMDYGPAAPDACVLKDGACDMGESALQAARNVHARYGVPYGRIALTAMIGMNDVVSNVFSVADARTMAAGARALGLAGVHYWSLGRDKPCGRAMAAASDSCSGVDAAAGAFDAILSRER
jgi:chitinase